MPDALFPYQETGAKFLADVRRGILADGMRVGKTAAAIRACDLVGAKDVLWVTTGSARTGHLRAWQQFQRTDRKVTTLMSGASKLPREGVIITSYPLASAAFREIFHLRDWDAVVLDEGHRLKNPDSARTQAFYGKKCDGVGGIIKSVDHVFSLTGTPASNHPAEIWSTLRALAPQTIMYKDKVMSFRVFRDRFCTMVSNGFGMKITGGRNLIELRERMAPVLLRRTLDDIAPDLPKVRISSIEVDDDGAYDALKWLQKDVLLLDFSDRIRRAATDEDRALIMAELDESTRKRFRKLTGIAKIKPIAALVKDEIEDGLKKIVLFAWHKEVLEGLAAELGSEMCVVLGGSTPPHLRQSLQDEFRDNPKKVVFLGQIIAAGEAIDLSIADDALMVEMDWNPGNNAQAAHRIVNITKHRPTSLRCAALAGSTDEDITRTLIRRTKMLDVLFG